MQKKLAAKLIAAGQERGEIEFSRKKRLSSPPIALWSATWSALSRAGKDSTSVLNDFNPKNIRDGP